MQQKHTQLTRLLEIMERLRDPETGCPWDVKQTFETIAPYTIEEAYEVSEAIASGDRDKICDELGDLLLQVVFHAQMATEEDSFTFEDVAKQVSDKMVRRHPHVFGNFPATDEQHVKQNWEAIKRAERSDASNGQKNRCCNQKACKKPATQPNHRSFVSCLCRLKHIFSITHSCIP